MDLLKRALDAAAKILRDKATHKTLKEDEALLNRESEGPGLHIHDETNPLGQHRHKEGETVDGAHTHTPENPEGVHAHGDLTGQPLVDGAHYHEDGGTGWHHHKEEDLGVSPSIHKPGLTI